jgi:hypothetical protein
MNLISDQPADGMLAQALGGVFVSRWAKPLFRIEEFDTVR